MFENKNAAAFKYWCFFLDCITLKMAKYETYQSFFFSGHLQVIFQVWYFRWNDWYLKRHASSDLSGAPSQHLCGHLWLWDLSLCFKPDILLLLYQVRVTVFSRTARVDCADPKTLLCDWTSSVMSVTDWQTRSRKDFLWTHALPNSNNSGLDCISVLFVHDAIFDQRLLVNIMSNTELQTLLC